MARLNKQLQYKWGIYDLAHSVIFRFSV